MTLPDSETSKDAAIDVAVSKIYEAADRLWNEWTRNQSLNIADLSIIEGALGRISRIMFGGR